MATSMTGAGAAAGGETEERGAASDPRWPRILARDGTADGLFWYSVRTTGVYCRPSCPSRGANPLNVAIHDMLAAARATGFRPCRRCRPEGDGRAAEVAAIVAATARLIEAAETPPPLSALARAAGLSPAYLHRLFRSETGITPKAYADAHRAGRLRDALAAGARVTEAAHDAGFGSAARLHARADGLLGMTPRRFGRGGAAETLRFAVGESVLGSILVASSEKGVASITIGDDPAVLLRGLQDRFPAATLIGGDAGYEAVVAQVVALAAAPGGGGDLPLDIRGTAFQQRVWAALRRIPPGTTATYAQIAAAIGAPAATRAVAGACAANAHAIVIPCHRVVRTDGSLSGYRWGVERKRRLIDSEANG